MTKGEKMSRLATGREGPGGAPKCRPVAAGRRYRSKAVRSVYYEGRSLVVAIQGEHFVFAHVVFSYPVGFRVLDSSDLSDLLTRCRDKGVWLWEVTQGGWLELERQRQRFSSAATFKELKEFLIIDYQCVSVLSVEPPRIIDLGTDPRPMRPDLANGTMASASRS